MSKGKLLRQFFQYLAENKKLWLLPVLIVLGIVAIAILVSQSQAIAPFIYSLF
jgi:hypothetical protein